MFPIGQFAPHVAHNHVRNHNRLAGHFEFDGAFLFVGQTPRQEGFNPPLVILLALTLKVRPKPASARACGITAHRSLVPIEPEPAQSIEDDLDRLLGIARHVGILDAQDESAAGVPGIQPVEQRRARPADVQEPRRTGSKTNTNFHGGPEINSAGRKWRGKNGRKPKPSKGRRWPRSCRE